MRIKDVAGVSFVVVIFITILLGSDSVLGTESTVTILSPDEIVVIYDEYRDSDETTDFDSLDFSGLMSIDEMTLENDTYGKIRWLETIDLTLVAPGNIVDLDKHVEIDDNLVFVNTTHFTNLAFPVNISFYDVGLSDPRILKNGEVCGEPDCLELNYESGVYVFNTSGLFPEDEVVFKLEENPSGTTGGTSGSGSSGSGGTGTVAIGNFTLSEEVINVKIVQGNTVREKLEIINNGDKKLDFVLKLLGLENIISFSETEFRLEEEENKTIVIDFFIGEDEPVNVRTGNIFVETLGLTRLVNVVVQIIQRGALFDLVSELDDSTLSKQQQIEASIEMTDIGNVGKVDVLLEYFIKDFEEKEIKIGEEELEVDGSNIIERRFSIPRELALGNYVFVAELTYQNSVATSANPFKIIDLTIFWIILLALILGMIFILLFLIKRYKDDKIKVKKGNKVHRGVVLLKGQREENLQKIILRHIKELLGK